MSAAREPPRQALVERGDGFRGVGAGHDVLALCPEEDVAVQDVLLAGGRVAREQDAGRGVRHRDCRRPWPARRRRCRGRRRCPLAHGRLARGRCPRSGRRPRPRRAAAARDRRGRCPRRRCRSTSTRAGAGSRSRRPGRPRPTARPSVVAALRPRLRMVSSMPGMETGAPERTLTSSGSRGSPKVRPTCSPMRATCARSSASSPARPAVAPEGLAGLGGDDEAGRHGQRRARWPSRPGWRPCPRGAP